MAPTVTPGTAAKGKVTGGSEQVLLVRVWSLWETKPELGPAVRAEVVVMVPRRER